MLSNLSIRVRLLLASTVVQVAMLTLLLTNSGRLMNEATTASLNTLIAQNAGILNVVTATFVPQGRYNELQDALGELLNETNEGLIYVRIVDSTGQTRVRAGLPEMLTLPQPDDASALKAQSGATGLLPQAASSAAQATRLSSFLTRCAAPGD